MRPHTCSCLSTNLNYATPTPFRVRHVLVNNNRVGAVPGHSRRLRAPTASASAAAGWPSRDPHGAPAQPSNSNSSNSSGHVDTAAAPGGDGGSGSVHPLATALATILLAARDAAAAAAAGFRSTARRAARMQVWLGRPEALLFREGCQLLACMIFILLYVWSTYSPVVHGSGRWWLDLLLSGLFAADYVHRTLTTSRHPLLAALHPLALIDLLSFAPSLLGVLLPEYVAPWGWDLRWFRVFRALRLLRLSLLSGNLSTMKTNRGVLIAGNLNVPLVWLVASVVAWMFTSASCVAVMEKMPWHDALYFVGSTLTTVGYGDVVVHSSVGRLFVLVMMLVGVVLIPVRAGQLYSRLAERLLVAGHKPGDAPGTAGGYVVLSGRLSDVRGFNDFLQDFLVQVRHLSAWSPLPGGGRQGLQLVCLCNKPSVEFLALQELHEAHLTLVEGSAFSERDLLHRAGLPASLGAMVLADRFSSNATAEDTDVQFRVWAIKSAVKRLPLYVQVLRRSSVDVISPFLDPFLDVIMSVEGTRMRLLALSSLVPGASTLVANLLRSSGPNAGFAGGLRSSSSGGSNSGSSGSSGQALRWASSSGSGSGSSSPVSSVDSYDDLGPLGLGLQKLQAAVRSLDDVMLSGSFHTTSSSSSSNGGGIGSSSSRQGAQHAAGTRRRAGAAAAAAAAGVEMLAGRRWLREYADGAHCELFMVPAGPPLAGLRFTDAVQAVYEASGAMLVGLIEGDSQRLLLNPSSHSLHQEQQLVVLAPTYRLAQAAAAGAGVESVLYSQALAAAQAEAEAAADAVVAAHTAGAQQLHGSAAGATVHGLHQQPQQQQSRPNSPPSVGVGDGNTSGSSSGGSSRAQGSLSSVDGGSRSVIVRVPESLASELSGSSAGGGAAAGGSHAQQRQCAEQQPQLHQWQQLDHQQLQPQPASPVAGAVFAESGHYADAYAAFEQHQQQQQRESKVGDSSQAAAAGPAAAAAAPNQAVPGLFEGGKGDDDLVSGCLAPWSGAFESDSLDETELCTDSEMLEAALLQRQRQQAHAERLQQQEWLLTSSYDSASGWKELNAAGAGVGLGPAQQQQQQQQLLPQQGLGVQGRSSSPGGRSSGRNAEAAGLPPSSYSPVSVTSITAAALDKHMQQQQQSPTSSDSPPQQGQQQQQHAGTQAPELPVEPSQLQGHFILTGCASSFVPFARQLAASASPAAEPLTLVLMHPEHQGAAMEAIRRMGVAVHYVAGRSSDAAALLAAGAKRARSLVYVGPSERPVNLPVLAVSGVYGDPTSTQASHADVSGSSRTAVLADADALSSCYGVGEVFLPDSLATIVELGFTSSIRFLQPGLLLHGRPAPHSSGSVDEAPGFGFPGARLLGGVVGAWSRRLGRVLRRDSSNGSRSSSPSRGSGGSMDGGGKGQGLQQPSRLVSHPLQDSFLASGSPAASRPTSPGQQQLQPQQQPVSLQQQTDKRQKQLAQQQQRHEQQAQHQEPHRTLAWPWQQKQQQRQRQQGSRRERSSRLPRSSWRHRKEIEEAGQLEGLTEWQLNSYYAAGRVMVPALLDVFTCQGFFKRQALLDLLTELAGDDGRPGGAMLVQQAVPTHLVGCCYRELVAHYLSHPDPLQRHIPLGLLRKKAENRAWRLPYVATHPHPESLLQATDMVFLIRPQ